MEIRALKHAWSGIRPRLKGVCLVYLFGSRVQGNLGPASDYDIAALADRDVDEQALLARLAHELSLALNTDQVDVVSLNRAPIELPYAIIAQGKLLYERDVATRVDYEAKILGLYGDLLPMLRAV